MPTSEKNQANAPMTVMRFVHGGGFLPKGKKFILYPDGTFRKSVEKHSFRAGGLGNFTVLRISTASDLVAGLEVLEPGEVCVWGAPPAESGGLAFEEYADPSKGVWARSSESFPTFAQDSILCLDCDMPDAPDLADYVGWLREAVGFDSDLVGGFSSSAGIRHAKTGGLLSDTGGLRVYAILRGGERIPDVLRLILDRGWLRDPSWSRWIITEGGRADLRGAADLALKTPCQADFAAGGALLEGELVQDRTWTVFEGATRTQDVRTLNWLTERELKLVTRRKFISKAMMAPEIKAAWEAYALKRAREEAVKAVAKERFPDVDTALEKMLPDMRRVMRRAALESRLGEGFPLQTRKGDVTISEVLTSPLDWHMVRTKDPLDPDYHGGEFCCTLLTEGGTAFLQVHHGPKQLYVLGSTS